MPPASCSKHHKLNKVISQAFIKSSSGNIIESDDIFLPKKNGAEVVRCKSSSQFLAVFLHTLFLKIYQLRK